MRTLPWRSDEQVASARGRIWRYLVPSISPYELLLEAGALLQMRRTDVLELASVHWLLSEPVSSLVEELPSLLRRLATTTEIEEEESPERLRGPITWGRTFAARAATGNRNTYVTVPARRAFDTVENDVLVHVLDSIASDAERTGWVGRTGSTSERITERARMSRHARESHMLRGLRARPPNPRAATRLKTGRFAHRYRNALKAYELHEKMVRGVDRRLVKKAVEDQALATASPGTLFEIISTFDILDQIERTGWKAVRPLRLIRGQLHFEARRATEVLDLWYQHAPRDLTRGSRYLDVQRGHALSAAPLRPDVVLRKRSPASEAWLLVEMKMGGVARGLGRDVEGSARAAIRDLLMYRRDFEEVLAHSPEPYGLGLVWGAELQVAEGEVMLCTPDHLTTALEVFLG